MPAGNAGWRRWFILEAGPTPGRGGWRLSILGETMSARSEKLIRIVHLGVGVLAVAFLAFVAGIIATLNEVRATRVFQDAYRAGTALYSKMTQYNDPLQYDLWRPVRTADQSVTTHEPGKVQDGLTLYTSGHAQKAFLMDMEGRHVHEWGIPFSQIWDKAAAVKKPQPDTHIYIEKAVLYPNGDVLALYVAVGDTPWGYGLVKMDKDSRIIWKYLAHVHHDLNVAPDGNIHVLTQEIGTDDIPQASHLRAPRIDDYVVVLSPEGKELRKVRLLDAMLRSPYARLLETVPWYISKGSGDYLHTNTIDVLDGRFATKLPQATAGRVMLSFREIGTIAILDLEQQQIVWATRGPWLMQHDPDLLANGNILLFDNQGNSGGPGGMTRVIEFDPASLQIVWSYAGTAERPFESAVRSSQERLANGNTLIVESDAGRMFEVTPEGEIVWDFVNPVRGTRTTGEQVIPILFWAVRVDRSYFAPEFLVASAAP